MTGEFPVPPSFAMSYRLSKGHLELCVQIQPVDFHGYFIYNELQAEPKSRVVCIDGFFRGKSRTIVTFALAEVVFSDS